MSDIEAYELLLEYCGGEKGLILIKDMIHVGGLDVAVKNTIITMEDSGIRVPEDFKEWIRQSFQYIQTEMTKPNN